MSEKNCSTCNFGIEITGGFKCVRFPPAVNGIFPIVNTVMWCGEWSGTDEAMAKKPVRKRRTSENSGGNGAKS